MVPGTNGDVQGHNRRGKPRHNRPVISRNHLLGAGRPPPKVRGSVDECPCSRSASSLPYEERWGGASDPAHVERSGCSLRTTTR